MLHDIASKKSEFANPFQSFDHREFLCGCGSALINIAITYPVYKMIFRQVSEISIKTRKRNFWLTF